MQSRPTDSPPTSASSSDPHSSFRLEIALSIGYQRRRAVLGTKWEGTITTLILLLGSIAVVLWFLYLLTGLRVP